MIPGDTYEGGVLRRPARLLQPGDRVDFQADPLADPEGYADPEGEGNPLFLSEWAVVEAVVRETPDSATVYTDRLNFCFPADHMLDVDAEQTPEERAANLAEYAEGWRPGDYIGPRGAETYMGETL